jgi:hypothetical protein
LSVACFGTENDAVWLASSFAHSIFRAFAVFVNLIGMYLSSPKGADAQDGRHRVVLLLDQDAPGPEDEGKTGRHPHLMGAAV